MTLEEVQARREEVWEVVRKHGVDRLTVVVSDPEAALPYDYDAYFEVGFTPEAKAETRGLAYASALTGMAEQLSELLGCRAWVGDLDGEAAIRPSGEDLQARATPL